ncbi:MAG TPA: MFS transporter [Rhodanobacteraceae bacterium]|nr:MFS transporter [Rhodanobacteraceae bacterium]
MTHDRHPLQRPAPAASPATAPAVVGRYRWRVCALLFAATTLSYLDRQVLGVLAPFLQARLGWTDLDYGYIVSAFQIAYALGLVGTGALIDRFGTRIGYALAIGVWSLAAMAHALAGNVAAFIAARFALGLGEAGNFPAAIKTVAEWFPLRERALAAGIFNAGASVGAIAAPLLVPWITLHWGWRASFLLTGALSLVWVAHWLYSYRAPDRQPRLSAAERAYIEADSGPRHATKIPWLPLLRYRQTWAFLAGKFITDPVWWFYLFWLPKFLHSTYGLNLVALGPPLIAIFLCADAGSVAGGWAAGWMLHRGWSPARARKTAMLICALAVVPVILAAKASNLWVAVAVVGLATAAHQGWSANLFTLVSDMFPREAVASVVGIGGFGGAVSGALVSTAVGLVLELSHSYVPVFVLAGSAYVVALLVIHLLVPHLEPAVLATPAPPAPPLGEHL